MKKSITIIALLFSLTISAQQKLSVAMANTARELWPDSFLLEGDKVAKWRYDQGVILKGMEKIWNYSGDAQWFRYIQKSMDFYVDDNGNIRGYRPDEYNIDHINNGKLLLTLYRVTGKEKYRKAALQLREQLRTHPRTNEGGFWHKKIYPYQMWLDGLYMAQPFYAEYAMLFGEDTAFNDIAKQFILMEKNARDVKTGLLYHGWDESRQQQWANKQTGLSPNFWGRSLGWFGMALVDVLDYFPQDHPQRKELINILFRLSEAVSKVADSKTGLWYDVPDKISQPKNYPEASASAMLIYTISKGVRKGYLPARYMSVANKAWASFPKQFITNKENGNIDLKGTVAVSGLGGKPYRDGSFEYYMSEPVIVNDPKGIGAFINCAVEMEIHQQQHTGRNKKVVLDLYFNNEWKADATGRKTRWHYTWDDRSNGGYAMLGDIFNKFGAATSTLNVAPTVEHLKTASVYIIVDPDTEKETDKPNFITHNDARTLVNWVKSGGVLVLLGNDAGNSEFTNFNKLAALFGVHFNEDSKNRVQGDQFDQGKVVVSTPNKIFKSPHQLYIKEYSSLSVTKPAVTVLTHNDDNVMAIANIGKGKVFFLGDPWIYNEYLDGRKLPAHFDNYAAAEEWVKWLISK